MNCGTAREKINRPKHTAGRSKTKGLRNSRKEPAHTLGGRGGERGKLSPREATAYHPANRPRFLSKDFLRFWMVDTSRQEGLAGRVSARGQLL